MRHKRSGLDMGEASAPHWLTSAEPPAKGRMRAVKQHAAMPFAKLPAFLARVRDLEAVSARALEFTILTAGRTGEVIGARWDEIDEANKVWIVPASRMKAKKEHRVPLVGRAWDLIAERRPHRQSEYVFPGLRPGNPLSNVAMDMTLRRLEVEVTVHGFRSSFRDWAAERSVFAGEVVEMALAHTIGSKVEAAYRRGDLFAKRRQLMEAWNEFCAKQDKVA